MARIVFQAPEQKAEAVELGEEEALLVGRQPDPAENSSTGLLPAGLTLRTLVVASPSVSANHVEVWREGRTVCLRDVGSRNGSWLLLPRNQRVQLPEAQSVFVQLAAVEVPERDSEEPADAVWSNADTYGEGIVQAVKDWLRRLGIAADISLHKASQPGALTDEPGRIPVAGGMELRLVSRDTLDAQWARVLQRVWQYVSRQNLHFEAERQTRDEGLILASPAIRTAHREIVNAAAQHSRVLLLGPSGSGKEGLARTYHRHSGRSGAFVALNCSMLGKELLRSELFGAEEGAFTGAVKPIVGAVERAHGGTLFLDEVADMPAEVQPMLLRFLDEGEYERMGSYGRPRRADVQIICATNKDLRAATREGKFRSDLWYRLSIQVIDVPPLRDRFEDVVAYLRGRPLGEGLSAYDALTSEALELLRKHCWDGNFRELANFVERLPRAAIRGGVDARGCRRALEQGALLPVEVVPAPTRQEGLSQTEDWSQLAPHIATRALQAFVEDRRHVPQTWDDQKEFNERYLKPLFLFHMSGASRMQVPRSREEVLSLAHRVASVVKADRATAVKQLVRYFERFGG